MKKQIPNYVFALVLVAAVGIIAFIGYKAMNPQKEVNVSMDERKKRMSEYMQRSGTSGSGNTGQGMSGQSNPFSPGARPPGSSGSPMSGGR
jgi:hypothetical protein